MTAATRAPSAQAWADAFAEASNTDPEIQAHGKYFTCSYLLDATERRYVVEVQSGRVVIPKSVTPERIEANFDVFGFELSGEQVRQIDGLDEGNRLGGDPETADF